MRTLLLFAFLATTTTAAESSLGIIAGERNALQRETHLRLALENASAAEIEQRIVGLTSSSLSATGAREYLVGIELLARKTGERALGFAQGHRYPSVDDRSLRRAFVHGWARGDFEAAATWIGSASAALVPADRNEAMEIALRVRAGVDPDRAMASALREAERSDDPVSARENYVTYVIEALAERGEFELARRLITDLVPQAGREVATANLIGLTVEHRPELAVRWFEALPAGESKQSALMRLEEVLSEIQPGLALSVYRKLDSAACSPDLADLMIWHATRPPREWIEALLSRLPPGESADPVVTSAILKTAATDLASVPWAWFERFVSASARKAALLRVVVGAKNRDKPAARALLARATFLSETERAAVLARLGAGN